jgi:hypothetical protein
MPKSTFEAEFKAFVEAFGGEVVPEEATARSADYVFRKYNVVAELKCLVVDQTAELENKLSGIIEGFRPVTPLQPDPNVSLLHCTGKDGAKFDIPFDEKFQRAWSNALNATIESRIRDATKFPKL